MYYTDTTVKSSCEILFVVVSSESIASQIVLSRGNAGRVSGSAEKSDLDIAYEKELMVVVLAIQHCRPYLIGNKFTVCTDQKSLKQLMQQRLTIMDQQNWVAKLLGYQFDVVYKPGLENNGANALSRQFDTSPNNTMVVLANSDDRLTLHHSMIFRLEWLDFKAVHDEVQQDPTLQAIISALQKRETTRPGFKRKLNQHLPSSIDTQTEFLGFAYCFNKIHFLFFNNVICCFAKNQATKSHTSEDIKPGLENNSANALSRQFDTSPNNTMVVLANSDDRLTLHHSMIFRLEWLDFKAVHDEVQQDPTLQAIISALQKRETTRPGFALQNGVLLY
ncbi:unnamed protein product [Vicia faba]|uniref:Reverse transcriptase RNase H-like domain-containing protein n=1 Tax=Vicia faba TaxID=3906 RepID=A0AAV1AXB5_VICFA|nr:unnamed protein product [Vicia faba]